MNGDPGVRSALNVDGGDQVISSVTNGGPCHRWGTTGSLEIDRGKDGLATGVVRTRVYVIRLESLGGPDELVSTICGEGGTTNASERAEIVVLAATGTSQGNDALKRCANRDADEGSVEYLASNKVP